MKNVCFIFLAAICFIGCKSLERLPGLEKPHTTGPTYNPDDVTIEGTTKTNHDVVYIATDEHTVTVEVKRPGAASYELLKGPETGSNQQYREFDVPTEGVYFENLDGGFFDDGNPVAPIGTQYKVRSVKN